MVERLKADPEAFLDIRAMVKKDFFAFMMEKESLRAFFCYDERVRGSERGEAVLMRSWIVKSP